MLALGERLAARFSGGGVVYLEGELGVGKTTLVRGILRGLGHRGRVKSPTYTLVEPYEPGGRRVFHFDLYRLADPEELEYLGIRDYFPAEAIVLVEWPERGEGMLPPADLRVSIRYQGAARLVSLEAGSERDRDLISRMTDES